MVDGGRKIFPKTRQSSFRDRENYSCLFGASSVAPPRVPICKKRIHSRYIHTYYYLFHYKLVQATTCPTMVAVFHVRGWSPRACVMDYSRQVAWHKESTLVSEVSCRNHGGTISCNNIVIREKIIHKHNKFHIFARVKKYSHGALGGNETVVLAKTTTYMAIAPIRHTQSLHRRLHR